jgi:uncharacterized membrane protein YjfL (UPF0719 family)
VRLVSQKRNRNHTKTMLILAEKSFDERLITTDWLVDSMFSWKNLIFLFIALGIFVLAKGLFLAPIYFRKFFVDKKELAHFRSFSQLLFNDGNTAVAVQLAGFMIGCALVVRGSLSTPKEDLADQLLQCFMFTLIGFILIGISHVITDAFVLWGINSIVLVVRDGNVAVGAMVAFCHIASGIILGLSITESAADYGEQIASTILWWAIGHIALVVFAWVYMLITKYDDLKLIKQGRVAAAVGFGLVLVSNAIMGASAFYKSDELLAFVISWGIGSLALIALRVIIDLVVLRGRRLDDEIEEDDNWGAAVVEGMTSVAFALMWWSLYRADKPCVQPSSD